MSRERPAELMDRAFRVDDAKKWKMLAEFLKDKMTEEELRVDCLSSAIIIEFTKASGVRSPEKAKELISIAYDLAAEAVADAQLEGDDGRPQAEVVTGNRLSPKLAIFTRSPVGTNPRRRSLLYSSCQDAIEPATSILRDSLSPVPLAFSPAGAPVSAPNRYDLEIIDGS
jgi:hypothetical protein